MTSITGFPTVRENLEKALFLEKVRENLEKSGKFCKISQKSGKSQGIFFPECLNLMVFSQSLNLYFSNFFLIMIMITTKINTLVYCKTDRGVFLLHHEKLTGQGKKVYFHLVSGKNYPFSALLSGKMGVFFTKSHGKLFCWTAGNPRN